MPRGTMPRCAERWADILAERCSAEPSWGRALLQSGPTPELLRSAYWGGLAFHPPSPQFVTTCDTDRTPRPDHPFLDRTGARSPAGVVTPFARGVSVPAPVASPGASAGRTPELARSVGGPRCPCAPESRRCRHRPSDRASHPARRARAGVVLARHREPGIETWPRAQPCRGVSSNAWRSLVVGERE
jgi:hypothetical protein